MIWLQLAANIAKWGLGSTPTSRAVYYVGVGCLLVPRQEHTPDKRSSNALCIRGDGACGCVQVLTPADDVHHINKHNFKVPFVCGCRDLGEALRRIAEGAAMIRTKVVPGSSCIYSQGGCVGHCRA